jgi:NAD(P)-dependent dehydrogenase (short-subunit alcohol dehydrogenase family)
MPASLTRSVLLVGPGRHFGYEVARRFAVEGFRIGLIARTRTNVDPISRALELEGHPCASAIADVRDTAQIGAAVSDVASSLGSLDCVIFNVRDGAPERGLELAPADLTNALATSVSGALAVIQSACPLLERRSQSTVILTGGGYKDRPEPTKLALSVSKAALHALFLALSTPLQSRNILIKTVIVDGVVRPSGPLLPRDVADVFWNALWRVDGENSGFPRAQNQSGSMTVSNHSSWILSVATN